LSHCEAFAAMPACSEKPELSATSGRLFGWIEGQIRIVDIPLNESRALEGAADPLGDPLHQALELLRTRRRNRHEH
jgi:hypothetical protein